MPTRKNAPVIEVLNGNGLYRVVGSTPTRAVCRLFPLNSLASHPDVGLLAKWMGDPSPLDACPYPNALATFTWLIREMGA
ncbi:MAG: hypothetical protein WCA35_05815 [Kovacikia sp.]